VIAPVIPPQSPLQELIYGPHVTNRMVRTADGDLVYGLCTVGDGGRVLDKHTVAALDWRPGTRLELTRLDAGVLLARKSPDGHTVIAAGGYFRVPYRLRRQVGLLVGDRTLLIGHRIRNQLLIHPPAALDELCAASLRLLEEVRR
jgi:hypothetical protein